MASLMLQQVKQNNTKQKHFLQYHSSNISTTFLSYFCRTKHRHVLQALQQNEYYINLQAVQKENTKKFQNTITGIFLSNSVHTELKNRSEKMIVQSTQILGGETHIDP